MVALLLPQTSRVLEGAAQQELDLCVEAAQLGIGPTLPAHFRDGLHFVAREG